MHSFYGKYGVFGGLSIKIPYFAEAPKHGSIKLDHKVNVLWARVAARGNLALSTVKTPVSVQALNTKAHIGNGGSP